MPVVPLLLFFLGIDHCLLFQPLGPDGEYGRRCGRSTSWTAMYVTSHSSRVDAPEAAGVICSLIPNAAERGLIWNRATAATNFLVIPGEITLATLAHGALPRAARRPWGARIGIGMALH